MQVLANNPTAKDDTPIRRGRDLKVDLIRGLALLIIFVDHNAFLDNASFGWLTAFTPGRFSFIDAADVFFFISGYVSGIIYTNVLLTQGFVACWSKALKRCLCLYAAEVTLFLFCSVLILSAPLHDTTAPWSAFHRLRDLPAETLVATVTLRNPPPLFDLLPIYIVFISLTPFALWLRIHRPLILGALSIGLYLASQSVWGLQGYTYANLFNPFAWQLVFVGGLLMGFGKVCNLGRRWTPDRKLVAAAVVGLLVIGLLRLGSSERLASLLHTQLLTRIAPQDIPLTGKQNVGVLRFVNLVLWLIVIAAINPASEFFRKWAVRLPLVCGQNSLAVFCVSVFLNYVVLIYARSTSVGKIRQLAWNVIGCGALIVTAIGWRWLKRIRFTNSDTHYPVSLYVNRSLQYLGALAYAIWQGSQDFWQ